MLISELAGQQRKNYDSSYFTQNRFSFTIYRRAQI